jgi:hypothetical protein
VQIDLLLNEAGDARDKLAAIVDRGNELPSVAHGMSLAILGDWALVHDETAAAADYYDRAYRLLHDSREVNADEYFSMPRSVTLVPPLSAVDRGARRRAWAWGDLELKFEVSTSGHVHNVETVSIEPALRTIESSYTRRLRESRFRPRLIAGQAVATADVNYVQSFRYYVDNERSDD